MAGIPSSKPRRHQGDIMSVEKRSAVMSRIKGTDTGPEKQMVAALAKVGLSWESHARDLPGKPDFVFRKQKVAVFVDGDFWHGWRFPQWRNKLSEKWEAKIDGNRRRDCRNHRRLRRLGWRVLRLWEHQIARDIGTCVNRILGLLEIPELDNPTTATRKRTTRKEEP
jgi:DNA mismatch endonuclease (patch repair protein)